jgi:hypothetical protein
MRIFANTLVPITISGKTQLVPRGEALIQKLFERAMKGNVSALRYLHGEFSKNTEMLAELKAQYDRLVYDFILNNPDFGRSGYELPTELVNHMTGLRTLLNFYFPDDYPLPEPSWDEDGTDDED